MPGGSLGSYQNFTYKAYGKQGATILIPQEFQGRIRGVSYVTQQGTITTSYMPGNVQETGALKFNLNRSPEQLTAGTVRLELDDGTIVEQSIENPMMDFRSGSATAPQNMNSGPGGAGGGGFAPGQVGQYGVYPAYQGYPDPTFANYKKIKSAPYQYTDPFEFASQYGDFARGELTKNQTLGKSFALDQQQTELEGLQRFVPAASALRRSETSIDNIFNLSQRRAMVDQGVPGARESLEAQTGRAELYARGRVPDTVIDSGLERNVRSMAADRAYAGGFGTQSSVSRKASDLMSAEQRLQLSHYGEQLLGTSLGARADLLLPPTQYSTAGSEVPIRPSVGGAELQSRASSELNAAGFLPANTAFQSMVQQRQFQTGAENATRQFNAGNMFSLSQFNTGIANQFAQGAFGYNVGYAGAVAGATQTDINAQTAIQQQQDATDAFQDQMSSTQDRDSISSIIAGVGAVGPSVWDTITDIGGGIIDWFSGDASAAAVSDSSIDTSFDAPPSEFDFQAAQDDALSFTESDIPVEHSMQLRSFSRDMDLDLSSYVPSGVVSQAARSLDRGASAVMKTAGIYNAPGPGRVKMGYDNAGRPLYGDASLVGNNSLVPGQQFASGVAKVTEGFRLTPEEKNRLNLISAVSGNQAFIDKLNQAFAAGDLQAFTKGLKEFSRALKPEKAQTTKRKKAA